MSTPSCPVTEQICALRMKPLEDRLEEIQLGVREIKEAVTNDKALRKTVGDHDKFIRTFKRVGLYLLAALACTGLGVGGDKLLRILHLLVP